MTDKELLQQALDIILRFRPNALTSFYSIGDRDRTIEAIRARLAQPEQEPVAWMYVNFDGECEQIEYGKPFDDPSVTPLYVAPPNKEWVWLTDEEVKSIRVACGNPLALHIEFARAIEAKLKEKNGF